MENGSTNRDHEQNKPAPKQPQQQQCLDPPSFRLPEDWDESRYELWSVRVPVSLNVNELNGQQITVTSTPTEQAVLGNFEHDDKDYALVTGNKVENETFRILQPVGTNDSDGDDDESSNGNDKKMMVTSSIPFKRHVNVVDGSCTRDVPDTELAPRSEVAPTPVDPVRHAYAPIPQKLGLKRRWMPPGVARVEHTQDATTPTKNEQGAKKRSKKHSSSKKSKQAEAEIQEITSSVDANSKVTDSTDKKTQPQHNMTEKKKSKKERKAEKKRRADATTPTKDEQPITKRSKHNHTSNQAERGVDNTANGETERTEIVDQKMAPTTHTKDEPVREKSKEERKAEKKAKKEKKKESKKKKKKKDKSEKE